MERRVARVLWGSIRVLIGVKERENRRFFMRESYYE